MSTLRHRHPSETQIVLLDLPPEEEQEPYEERAEGSESNEEGEEDEEEQEDEEEAEDAPNLLYECVGLVLLVGAGYYVFQTFAGQKTTPT